MPPEILLKKLIVIVPPFEDYWQQSDYRSDDYTLHSLFLEFTNFFRDKQPTLSAAEMQAIGKLVTACMAPDADLANAAATCFLENVASEACGHALEPYLCGEASDYLGVWQNDYFQMRQKFVEVLRSDTRLPLELRAQAIDVEEVSNSSFDKTYVEFLDQQIQLAARGPEWTERLRRRRENLHTHCNAPLWYGRIPVGDEKYTVQIRSDLGVVVHWETYEIDRRPGPREVAARALAPPDVLRATLRVLYVCAYTTRNWTLSDTVSRTQINDLWEAIHEIPGLLIRWHENAEHDLSNSFDEYNSRWPTPNLRAIYREALLPPDENETTSPES